MWVWGPRGNSAAHSALCWFSVTFSATHNQIGPFWCWFLVVWPCVCSRTPWVSPTHSPVRLGVSPAATTPQVFSEVLRLYIPVLGPWIAQSVSLPSCSSQFIHMWMWDRPVCQLPPCHPSLLAAACCESPPPGCPSPPLLLVWMNVSSLTPWLSDLHTVLFSINSGYFLFLNLLSSFWLSKEAEYVYLCLHLCWKSTCWVFFIWRSV